MADKAAMSAEDFNAWLAAMRLNDSKATLALGLGSRHTLIRYKAEGAPLYIGLACAALARGMPIWSPRDPRADPFAVAAPDPDSRSD
jgi:hypothetical protein